MLVLNVKTNQVVISTNVVLLDEQRHKLHDVEVNSKIFRDDILKNLKTNLRTPNSEFGIEAEKKVNKSLQKIRIDPAIERGTTAESTTQKLRGVDSRGTPVVSDRDGESSDSENETSDKEEDKITSDEEVEI